MYCLYTSIIRKNHAKGCFKALKRGKSISLKRSEIHVNWNFQANVNNLCSSVTRTGVFLLLAFWGGGQDVRYVINGQSLILRVPILKANKHIGFAQLIASTTKNSFYRLQATQPEIRFSLMRR